jgi:ADP-heptose:LPS heptosyltransferase
MLCSIPAIRALKQGFPEAEITLMGLPWAKMLIERFPQYFDTLIPFPGYPGFPEQPVDRFAFPDFITQVQQERFDLALQMQGSGGISNPLIDLFGARITAGFYTRDNYCPDEDHFILYPSDVHEVHRHMQLIESLGLPASLSDLEFPVTATDKADFLQAALPVTPHHYVVLHPGARGVNRQWEPANFAAVGDYCIDNGFSVVITGTKDEMDIVDSVIHLMKRQPVNAAGRTSLGAVAVLIQNAAALVSNCTGVSHIAAALQTKSIVISLDGEPFRWGPLNKHLHKTIDWTVTADLRLVMAELNGLLTGGVKV